MSVAIVVAIVVVVIVKVVAVVVVVRAAVVVVVGAAINFSKFYKVARHCNRRRGQRVAGGIAMQWRRSVAGGNSDILGSV
jgi:hypothetical protein